MSRDVGTIEPGKRADFVVLDADPLADIHNLRTSRWIVIGGQMLETRALRESVGFRRATGLRNR
jgi:imidazolonepropionase-like amidohydrolase